MTERELLFEEIAAVFIMGPENKQQEEDKTNEEQQTKKNINNDNNAPSSEFKQKW